MIHLDPKQSEAVEWLSRRKRALVQYPAGGGKCLGKGTPVLLYPGEVIPVERVCVGDKLIGPDSKPRTVVSVTKGTERLYQITPTKGDPYVVNESHILSLKVSGLHVGEKLKVGGGCSVPNDGVVNIGVLDYLNSGTHHKLRLKGWRTGVEFSSRKKLNKHIPPYLLGVWLGDGNSNGPAVTTMDPEIVAELERYATQRGVMLRKQQQAGKCAVYYLTIGKKNRMAKSNPFRDGLNELGVMHNKHIPIPYLTSSKENRLELLAGLMDTDGCLHHSGFDYVSKVEKLADGVCFLARSLGLAAYKNRCRKTCGNNGVSGDYFRVSISGDCSIVPCRIQRKKPAKRLQSKSVLVTGITVTPVGVGDYYGFEISGPDRLFLLGDFTVTHNTIIAAAALRRVVESKQRLRKVRVGWLANTTEQVAQAYKAMLAVFFDAKVETAEAAAVWGELAPNAPVELVARCAAANTDWSWTDALIGDEIHHAATAQQWQSQIATASGARWGFTATPPEDEGLMAVLMDQFGNDLFHATREAVATRLAPARVVMLRDTDQNIRGLIDAEIDGLIKKRRHFWMGGKIPSLEREISRHRANGTHDGRLFAELEGAEQQLWGQVAWQVCIELGIIGNQARNDAVVRTALNHRKDQTLVLVNQIEHGEMLSARIPGSRLCFSKMGKKKRAESLAAFAAGECKCLLATSLADEGLDLPNANVLVLVSGGRSNAKTEQRTGRVLRTFAGKTHGLIYDFADDLHPLMAKHSRRRVELYHRLGYTVT